MKRVLVAYASRHGSTADIADAIGAVIADTELDVAIRSVNEVVSVTAYDALIIGSAVYMDDWLPEARDFIRRNLDDIIVRPTWLFSSGQVGTVPPVPFNGASLVTTTGAHDHHVFGGKLDRRGLSVGERLVVKVLHVPARDSRDWPVVAAWATAIARSLEAVAV
jgi:menaquinone-dependent protoporphyrinogen oxidase